MWPFSLPATQVTPTLNLKNLTNELQSVVDWHTLGVNLNLKSHELSGIEEEHSKPTRRKSEMLSLWLQNTTNPSWEIIVQALRLMEAHSVADRIQRKYITCIASIEGIIV